MHFQLAKLCEAIGDENKIIIYGAGYFALTIYHKLCAVHWKDRIAYFAVTAKEKQPECIDNIPVVEYNDLLWESSLCILVAVSDAHVKQIEYRLSGIASEFVFYLWDYIGYAGSRVEALMNASFDGMCQFALDEYIWNYPSALKERENLLADMEATMCERKKEQASNKTIVYILEEETARDIKIIRALLEKGYQITVLQYRRKAQFAAEEELMELGVEIEWFDGLWDFVNKSLKYRPRIYFFDVETTFEYATVSVCHKDIWGKIVVAPYETFMGSFVGMMEETFIYERCCLENADGVVWRYFSKEYLQDKMGYRFKGDSIQLLDNCGGYEILSEPLEFSHETLKLCCVVSQIDSFLRQDETLYAQPARFVDLIDRLDSSCELHVFAWSASADAERQLRELAHQYTNFKYFLKVEHKELIKRLSAYDYGLCVYTNERIPDYPLAAETIWGGYGCTEGTYRYSVANRYFDYIDAGLAVITTLPEKLCEYLQKFDVIVRMNSSNLDIRYLKANRAYFKERAKNAKNELLMSKQIIRLTDLFEKICSEQCHATNEG